MVYQDQTSRTQNEQKELEVKEQKINKEIEEAIFVVGPG